MTRAVAALGSAASVRWSHDVGERRVAMQRLAHVAGLAYLSESHWSSTSRSTNWRATASLRAWPAQPAMDVARGRLRDPDGNIIFLYKAGETRRFPPWRID